MKSLTNKKATSMKITSILLTIVFASATILAAATEKQPAQKPLVQIAILLDTSGSMQGLIEQAKGQLWKVCNEFIKARQNGQAPEVQVALYEYGKTSLSQESGWIRQIQPLTTDLDKVSEELFALQTNGGDEYCGWVIKQATNDLNWSPRSDVYKVIFIAGNEPFTQGPVNYADSCKAAIAKGIVVNTIHCGDSATGIDTKWKDGATLADGKYLFIDHNRAVVTIEAPQDKEIAKLGEELNKTYLAYGSSGRIAAERQVRQDMNAVALAPASGAAVQRAVTKASSNYQNSGWDLIDAAKRKDFDISKLKAEDLPAEMKKMNADERKAFVEKNARERGELQAKINRLNSEREKYVARKMKETSGSDTLDTAMISAVREQGAKRDLVFK
ncbi:MAG TPA: vWA domain-containing protein [Chthoniobacterales bacterium]|nr:vWA domain-containing protein [Chthoniobacterales bacterium]